MAELWYRLTKLPDLTLNKYASLEGNGVDGVIEKHIAFLRQLNRKGIVSGLSYHLFYLYIAPEDKLKDTPGHRLQIFLMIRGKAEAMDNVPALIKASPLADFYELKTKWTCSSCGAVHESVIPPEECPTCKALETKFMGNDLCSIENVFKEFDIDSQIFNTCAFLTKTETLLPASSGEGEDYYMLREWEMNEDGRLYNMCKMMEALNRTALYRVDLYPVEKSVSLRESLRKPMSILRKRQDDRASGSRKDYDGKDVLENYEELIEKYDTSPHFVANIMVLATGKEDALSILDAAGAESLLKGKYNIAPFYSNFNPTCFLDTEVAGLDNLRERMVVRKGRPGLIVCREDTVGINLNYLPTLFSLEEIAPFFRLPALYDGEVIQMAKETAPTAVKKRGALFLGKDKNGYDVYFPLSLLPKHAFVSGVPGSGKTNTMHHITSSLWKDHGIPFLVLEPAKQEYRALANDPDMKDMYLFSPNADMSFPLHINPFEMPKGTLVAEHIRRLCSVFEGAFPLDAPMPFLLDTAIEAVYRELGWIPEHVYTGTEKQDDGKTRRPLPTMTMLYRRLEQELKSTQYSDEVRGNLESALKVRIGSLLRREMGDVFDVPESTFTPEKWLEVPAVIELESMGTGPANFLTLMLCSLIRETLKVNPHFDGDVRHVIFIEEAHNLIGPESEEKTGADADPKQAATAFVVKMLAEVRALKEGIVIADQLPTVMAQEVLKNTGLKIGLRITSADDRSLLGSTMAASALQLEQMSTFAIGEALIFYEKLMRPFTMRIKEWWGELKDDDKKKEMTTPKNDSDLRRKLIDYDTYIDENYTSIRIIIKKYQLMMSELETRISNCKPPISEITRAMSNFNRHYSYLQSVALRKIEMSDEELQHQYDIFESAMIDLREWFEEGSSILWEPALVAKILYDWRSNLDRLKKERWARFSNDPEDFVEVNCLQIEMQEKINQLASLYSTLAAAIKVIGSAPKEDLRKDLLKSVKKSGLDRAIDEMMSILQKMER